MIRTFNCYSQVDLAQIPIAGRPDMQYRPQQAVKGHFEFPPVSGPSQPQEYFGYQPSTVYQIGQPSPPMLNVRVPTTPIPRMPQYQAQTFEPRTREKKIIQIKDPNSNKDVTQEILNRHPSRSLTSSTGGTPNNTTPDISGQSSSSGTPPLTSQQEAEANVRAQFAAQVAATLRDTKEEKPRKPEYTIQKAPASNRAEIDNVQGKEVVNTQKEEALKETKTNDTVSNVLETQLAEVVAETQPKEVAVKSQPKEAAQDSKLSEGVSPDSTLATKSLVSSVDATTSSNEKISNVRVEIFTADDVRHPPRSLTSSAGGTPNNTTPDISGQSSSSWTPSLTSQQQTEANVRAQFAAQVAATLRDTTAEKPRKPEFTSQKAPAINRGEVDN